MNPKVERIIYLGIIGVLAILLVSFGKKEVELQKEIPITVDQLYAKLQNPSVKVGKNFQIIDVREYESEDEDDEIGGYVDQHIPGAIPLPDCDESKAPPEAVEHINPYLPTVIVSRDGNPEIFKKCAKKFTLVQNLKGGMEAWLEEHDEIVEEDEYEPPKAGGGGGCL